MQADQIKVVALLAYFFYTQSQYDRAIRLYAALELLDPADPIHIRGLALSYAAQAQSELALAALDRLALRGAVDAPFYLLRAQVLGALQRPEESASAMRVYLEMRQAQDLPQP
jgi:hypothetical protein